MWNLNLSDPVPEHDFGDLYKEITELVDEWLPKYRRIEGNVHGDVWIEGRLLDLDERIGVLVQMHLETRVLAEKADMLARLAPGPKIKQDTWANRQALVKVLLVIQRSIEKLGGEVDELVDPVHE